VDEYHVGKSLFPFKKDNYYKEYKKFVKWARRSLFLCIGMPSAQQNGGKLIF
jgi:hypothetical protein